MGLEEDLQDLPEHLREFVIKGKRILENNETELLVGIAHDVSDCYLVYSD